MMAGPPSLRERILEDHAALRADLEAVAALARRVLEGEADAVAALRRRALRLLERFEAHLELEDRVLVPAVRRREPEDADWLGREHGEQRVLVEYIVERLRDASRPDLVLGRDLKSLVDVLRDDMEHEERALLDDLEEREV